MVEEKKHIDRVFQEKLKDFEVLPEAKVWTHIEEELRKKKKRRIVPLWLRYGSAAAVLLLLTSSAIWFYNSKGDLGNPEKTAPVSIDDNTDSKGNNEIVIEEKSKRESVDDNIIKSSNLNSIATSTKVSNVETSSKRNKVKDQSTGLLAEKIETNVLDKNETQDTVSYNNPKSNAFINSNTEITSQQEQKLLKKKDISQAIEDNLTNTITDTENNKKNKWYVGPVIAPIQYNSFSNGSPISKSLSTNDKRTNTTLAYGLKINYRLNDRLSIQSGISSIDLSYKTKDVTAFVFSNQLSFSNNLTEETNIDGLNTIAVSNSEALSHNSIQASRGAAATLTGDLNQSISYVEIPLEAKYALTKTKIGINIVGGISTYILNENNISLVENGSTKSLGRATNINNVNFSGNLGLDFDYKINKKIFFNISPMFKYQMNTFSNDDGGFNPYFLGVYTGLNFRF